MSERYYRSREKIDPSQKALDEKLQNSAIQKIRRQIKDGELLLSNNSILKQPYNMVRKNQLLSTELKKKKAFKTADVVERVGLGRKKKPMKGAGLKEVAQKVKKALTKAHGFVKEKKLISKGARALGYDKIADVAEKFGYGEPDDGKFRNPVRGETMRQGCGGFADMPMSSTNYSEVNDITRGNGGSQVSSSRYMRKQRGGEGEAVGLIDPLIVEDVAAVNDVGEGKKRRRQRGGNFFDDVGNTLRKAHDFVKEKKLISKGARALGYHDIGDVAEKFGYGRGDSYPGYPYARDITMGNGASRSNGYSHDDQVINNINGFATAPLAYPNDPWNRGVRSNERGIGYSVDVNNFKPATVRNLYSRNAPMDE